ncbi:sce7725 family protein [Bombilactobacillus thymidiniphilus]|uniref:Sce7725 family protein n=1 Tax=Bombilactobacillus thymidiniphilus TaxID=2923363 RepID=A0ABY4PBU9_9LACO|nr:sce7725 family protein [Bombilactobacillus thymidiniphilus]UQS83070.1 sce7725 family protein [Bombilactobacillus thymidiniphilus]
MYYPLLRGKQNELLALRELLEEQRLSDKIVPVIEPTNASSSSTLKKTLEQFYKINRSIAVIQDSKLGNYQGFKNDEDIEKIRNSSEFIRAYFLNDNFSEKISTNNNQYRMFILDKKSEMNIENVYGDNTLLVIDTYNRDKMRDAKRVNNFKIIELNDVYDKKDRNQDYAEDTDQVFSSEHLFYKQDGFYGFSDYSMIGSEYMEKGFAPKAIAIHIVYFDNDNKLRIHHFVSDSNDGIGNPSRKFKEALNKLIEWYGDQSASFKIKNNSIAMNEFQELHRTGDYPGLGVVKRKSIKHHLEIMSNFLDGKIK